jgi:hypothetical protein
MTGSGASSAADREQKKMDLRGEITIDFMQLRVILSRNAERRDPPFAPPRL